MYHEQGKICKLGKPFVSQTGGMQFKQPRAFPLLIYGTKASPPGTIGKEARQSNACLDFGPSLTGMLKASGKPLLDGILVPGYRKMAFANMLPAFPCADSGKDSKTW